MYILRIQLFTNYTYILYLFTNGVYNMIIFILYYINKYVV